MKRMMGTIGAALSAALLMGAADGAWLQRVPPKDHDRVNPLRHDPTTSETAAAAGAQVFANNCSKCHGNDAMGRGNRPALISDRVAHASDGDLFWIVTNGNAWKGMPPWQMLPEKQRWQVVTYLRSLNIADTQAEPNSSSSDPASKKQQ